MSQTPPTDDPIADTGQETGGGAKPFDSQQRARIEALLDEWELSCEAGRPIPVETLCGNDPELTTEMRNRIEALRAVDKRLAARNRGQGEHKSMPALEMGSLIDELEFVSSGGLGEVFVGKDGGLHRRVAVKFMHAHLSGEAELRGQFALEAEITGRLEHPGVVPLYGAGMTEDERPFYAMRFIEGQTLDAAVKRYFKMLTATEPQEKEDSQTGSSPFNAELEFRRLLASFVAVCKTIAYAHNRGVVHRDLKPSNIMLGRFGETIVVDWGLAVPVMRDERFRSSGEETLAISPTGSQSGSASGRGSGTPAFMSPEQFSELAPTPSNDIYSLGATLFVVLCGKPPIRSSSLSDIRTDRLEGKLPKIDDIHKGVPKRLQAIAYKAMAREPGDRYSTALELAKDIERYLADEPVSAYRDSFGLRVARMARRHRSAAQATVLGLVGCFVIAGLAAVLMGGLARRADTLRDRNLATSSQFISRACGYEVDRIWRVLEFEAQATELRELVAASNAMLAADQGVDVENQSELHQWLESRLDSHEVPTVQKLFVLSKDGTQVARVPIPTDPQVGENFSFRDYYTGLGFDLPAESELARLIDVPLRGPKVYPSGAHMSAAYMSTLSDEHYLKVTLTVPIFAMPRRDAGATAPTDGSVSDEGQAKPEVIGLIGTSVEVGDVMSATQIGASQTWIVDLREDMVEGQGKPRKRGLLLHYPKSAHPTNRSPTLRLSSDLVEQLVEAEDDEIGKLSTGALPGLSGHHSIRKVLINGRSEEAFDLGWVVITAEPGEADSP